MTSFDRSNAPGLYVIAELMAKPGKADDLRLLLVAFAATARMEPGCQRYSMLEVQDEPGRFLTFENWADRASLDAHLVTPAMTAAEPLLRRLLARPFTMTVLTGLDV